MNFSNEITVEVNVNIDSLKMILEKNKFVKIEEYDMNDIYFVKKDFKVDKNNILDILKENLLIRNIIIKDKDIKLLTHKSKQFREDGEIIKQSKVECSINSIEEAMSLLEAIGYNDLLKINTHLMIYSNNDIVLVVQLVDNHIYIEIEETDNKTIEDLKRIFNELNIPIKGNDYFVKKAEIAITEMLSGN